MERILAVLFIAGLAVVTAFPLELHSDHSNSDFKDWDFGTKDFDFDLDFSRSASQCYRVSELEQ